MATTASAVPTLPTWEEYEQAARELSRLIESRIEPLVEAVGRVVNYDGEQKVDFADLGRFQTAISYFTDARNELDSQIARVKSTFMCLDAIRLEGRIAHEPPITQDGLWTFGYGPDHADA